MLYKIFLSQKADGFYIIMYVGKRQTLELSKEKDVTRLTKALRSHAAF